LRIRIHVSHGAQKKGRRTKPALATPGKGRIEQNLADAPFRGRGSRLCLDTFKGREAQVAGICEKQFLTLARHSNCQPGNQYDPVMNEVSIEFVWSIKTPNPMARLSSSLPVLSPRHNLHCEAAGLTRMPRPQ